MIDIKVNNKSLTLDANTRISFEIENPAFNTTINPGVFSLPLDLPLCPANQQLLNFPENLSNVQKVTAVWPADILIGGLHFLSGWLQLKQIYNDRYQINLQAGSGWFSLLVANRVMSDIKGADFAHAGFTDIFAMLSASIVNTYASGYNFACFTVKNKSFYSGLNQDAFYYHYINYFYINLFDNQAPRPNTFGGGSVNAREHSITPFPYIAYVLKTLFQEVGFRMTGVFNDDVEMQSLVLYNNYAYDELGIIHYFDTMGAPQTVVGNIFNSAPNFQNFQLKNHLPEDVTIGSFISSLRLMFCLGFFFDFRKRTVNIKPLKDILASTDYIDWTSIAEPEYYISDESVAVFSLKFTEDSTDALTPQKDKEININKKYYVWGNYDDYTLIGNDFEILFISHLNQFWVGDQFTVWSATSPEPVEEYSENLYPWKDPDLFALDINLPLSTFSDKTYYPEKVNENTIQVPAMPMYMLLEIDEQSDVSKTSAGYPDEERFWLIPQIEQKGSSSEPRYSNIPFQPFINPFGMRYLFYRGMQGVDASFYPLGSYDVWRINNALTGACARITGANYALYWARPDFNDTAKYPVYSNLTSPALPDNGLYVTWWKPWLDFLKKTKKVTRTIRFRPTDLQDIDFTKQYLIDRNKYMIGKIYLTITMNGIEPSRVDFYEL